MCTVGALSVAAVAVADSIGTKAVKPVSATLTATTVLGSKTRSFTTPDGQLTATALDLSGNATSSEPALNGPARLRLATVVDTGKGAGAVEGNLRIDTSAGRDTIARFDGVYLSGKVHGLLRGSAERPFQRLLANLSGDLALGSTPGLSNGKIGGTDAGGGAVLVQPGRCPAKAAEERVEATGTVSAVSSTSITVAGVTCSVPSSLAERVGKLKPGDRAEITCRREGSELVLIRVEGKKK